MKQSNKVVMECTTVPRYSLNSHSFIHSTGVNHFFLETTLFFSYLADYCLIISDVAASQDEAGSRRTQ